MWGSIKNIPDWRCKNDKTHHKAFRPPSPSRYFPLACRHWSHRLHFWNASWNSFPVSIKHALRFGLDHLNGIKPTSFRFQFHFWKPEEVTGRQIRGVRWVGWEGSNLMFRQKLQGEDGNMRRTLAWWSSQVCCRQSSGRRLHTLSRSRHKMSQ
jgi:hypothetical protein